ncbi:MAG: nitroreductase family deazaflavin-dependent oxidoreductase [Anaerolineae bacterium]|nr:nitroreductase family deazaflavin-dependent oxidoreductase [Anaerolineae bacterium]
MSTDPEEPQFLYVTTIGWKSGRPHEIEIWFVAYGSAFYIVSEMRDRSHWVQNIRRHPAITFRVGEQSYRGSGRVVDNAAEPELAAAVSHLMDAKYDWSDGLIVELRPDSDHLPG